MIRKLIFIFQCVVGGDVCVMCHVWGEEMFWLAQHSQQGQSVVRLDRSDGAVNILVSDCQ